MIYVDDLFFCPAYGQRYWCHMTGDSLEEIHQMAKRIGLIRGWFQDKGSHPHYDLVPSKRELAIKHGARPLTIQEYVRVVSRVWNKNGVHWSKQLNREMRGEDKQINLF